MFNQEKMIRVLLISDQELINMSLRMILQSEPNLDLVSIASNFEDSLLLSSKKVPDLILFLFDCILQEGNCIKRIPELLHACPSCKILILTACQNRHIHLSALQYGAHGVFTLNQTIELLIKAINRVNSGEVWINNTITAEMLACFKNPALATNITPASVVNVLTPRELSIARLASQGFQAKQIGSKLFISEKTVRNQLVIIYSKLGVHNHIELILLASQLGVLESKH